MEMIIGGAYQGKTEYARKQYPQSVSYTHLGILGFSVREV